jgi:GGDEF domain-containing protein
MNQCQTADFVGRLGGDEFIAIRGTVTSQSAVP